MLITLRKCDLHPISRCAIPKSTLSQVNYLTGWPYTDQASFSIIIDVELWCAPQNTNSTMLLLTVFRIFGFICNSSVGVFFNCVVHEPFYIHYRCWNKSHTVYKTCSRVNIVLIILSTRKVCFLQPRKNIFRIYRYQNNYTS